MRPIFRLTAGDADLTPLLADRLISLTVSDAAGMHADTLRIVVDDRDSRIAWPRTGVDLNLWLGLGRSELMGRFQVDGLEHAGPPARMTIIASAAAFAASLKEPRTLGRDRISIGDLVAGIAGRHGLTPRVSEDLAGRVLTRVDQTGESDLNLLTRLAKDHDAVAKPVAGRLLFVSAARGRSAGGELLDPIALPAARLTDWALSQTERPAHGAVIAAYTDAATGERRSERVEVPGADPSAPARTLRRSFASAEDARAAARAAGEAAERARRRLRLTLPGDAALRAETPVDVSGIRTPVDGRWSVVTATHTLDNQGYRVVLECEPPTAEEENGAG